jgi:hypothetical protein
MSSKNYDESEFNANANIVCEVELSCSYLYNYLQNISVDQSEYLFSMIESYPEEDFDPLHFLAFNIALEIVAENCNPGPDDRVMIDTVYNEDLEDISCEDVLRKIYDHISKNGS